MFGLTKKKGKRKGPETLSLDLIEKRYDEDSASFSRLGVDPRLSCDEVHLPEGYSYPAEDETEEAEGEAPTTPTSNPVPPHLRNP